MSSATKPQSKSGVYQGESVLFRVLESQNPNDPGFRVPSSYDNPGGIDHYSAQFGTVSAIFNTLGEAASFPLIRKVVACIRHDSAAQGRPFQAALRNALRALVENRPQHYSVLTSFAIVRQGGGSHEGVSAATIAREPLEIEGPIAWGEILPSQSENKGPVVMLGVCVELGVDRVITEVGDSVISDIQAVGLISAALTPCRHETKLYGSLVVVTLTPPAEGGRGRPEAHFRQLKYEWCQHKGFSWKLCVREGEADKKVQPGERILFISDVGDGGEIDIW